MAHRVLWAVAFVLGLSVALPSWAGSTIDLTQPVQGVPYNPAPIRQNFGNAASDINGLLSMHAGATAPSNPGSGELWLNTPNGSTIWTLNIWIGSASAWVPIASIDAVAGSWMPPVGGGALPNVVSAATTDIGAVPQAALQITGSQTIGSFGSNAPAGVMKFIVFTGSPMLVQNASSMILPGLFNLTLTPGSTAVALSLGAGNWQVLSTSGRGAFSSIVVAGEMTINSAPNMATVSWMNSASYLGGAFQYLPVYGEIVTSNTWGEMAIIGASRSSDNGSATCCAMGIVGVVVNDSTASKQAGWAGYLSAVRGAGVTGTTIGEENEVANLGAEIGFNPYSGPGPTTGATVNYLPGCGGEAADKSLPINQCSAVMDIKKAHAPVNSIWDNGIIFESDALKSFSGTYHAIDFAKDQMLTWWSSASINNAFMYSDMTAAGAESVQLVFRDSGLFYEIATGGVGGTPLFGASYVASAVNYPIVEPSITGQAIVFSATGSDTDISMNLLTKGAGSIVLGNPAYTTCSSLKTVAGVLTCVP